MSSYRSRDADEGMISLEPPRRTSEGKSPSFPTATPFQTASETRSSQNQHDQDLKLKKKAAAGGATTAGPSTEMPWKSPKEVGHSSSSEANPKEMNDLQKTKKGFDGKEGRTPNMDAPQYFPMDDEEVAVVSPGTNMTEPDAQIGAFAVQGRQVEHQDPGFISPHYEEDEVQPDPSTQPDGNPLPNTTNAPEANTFAEDMPVAAVLSPEPTPSTTVEEEVRRILAENTVEGQVIALDDNNNETAGTSEGENNDSGASNDGNSNSKSKGFCNKYIIIASILACVIVGGVVGVVIALSGGGGGSSNSSEEAQEGSPTSSPVIPAIDEFCSDFSEIETYLASSFADLWEDGAQPIIRSDGYDCTCVAKDPLEMQCDLTYSQPGISSVLVNSEMCTFVLQGGQYLPKTAAWCETADGSDYSHCETFEFCQDGKTLCSCGTNEGDMCPSCAICTNKQDVAMDCSGVENEGFNFVTTCKDGYSGSLLTRYAFPEIRASTEATSSAPIAPIGNPTIAPIRNPTKTPTTPSLSSPTKNPTLTPASPVSAPTFGPVLPATLPPTRSPTQSPPTAPPPTRSPTQSPPTTTPQLCEENTDCQRGACAFETFTGSAQMVCCSNGVSKFIYDWQVSPYPKSDDGRFCTNQAAGNACPFNELCESAVCVFGECKDDYQSPGASCDDNDDCQSGVCVGEVCKSTKQTSSDPCEEDIDCEFNACGFEKYAGSAQLVCCPSGVREFIYDWQYNPYPKSDDGHFCTGQATGDSCPYNNLCESGVCVYGKCMSGTQDPAAACDDNADCASNVCISQRCQAGKKGPSETCGDNDDCESNACAFETFTGSAQTVCCPNGVSKFIYDWQVSPYPKSDDGHFCTGQAAGNACPFNELCESAVCVFGKCQSEAQPTGAACDENSDCQSSVCVSEVCLESRQDASESCEENEDCEFNACGFETYTGSAQMVCCPSGVREFIYDWEYTPYPKGDDGHFCTGQATGAACPDNVLCESSVCVSGQCLETVQPAGQPCDENLDCQSTVCVSQVCMEDYQASNESCDDNQDCVLGKCGYESYTGSSQMVCCASGESDQIYTWEDSAYPKTDTAYFCTGQPTGARCPSNALCASNVCTLRVCE